MASSSIPGHVLRPRAGLGRAVVPRVLWAGVAVVTAEGRPRRGVLMPRLVDGSKAGVEGSVVVQGADGISIVHEIDSWEDFQEPSQIVAVWLVLPKHALESVDETVGVAAAVSEVEQLFLELFVVDLVVVPIVENVEVFASQTTQDCDS